MIINMIPLIFYFIIFTVSSSIAIFLNNIIAESAADRSGRGPLSRRHWPHARFPQLAMLQIEDRWLELEDCSER